MWQIHFPCISTRTICVFLLGNKFAVGKRYILVRYSKNRFLGSFLIWPVYSRAPYRCTFGFSLGPDLGRFIFFFTTRVDKIKTLGVSDRSAAFSCILVWFGNVFYVDRIIFVCLV